MKSEEVRGKRKMQIYVDGNAVRSGNGQKEYPFQTISEAAKIARPGDEVLVASGVYREYVDPANAGCEDARIVYRSVEPGKAVITGAEIVDNWEHLEGDVWTARVSNGLFGDYNPSGKLPITFYKSIDDILALEDSNIIGGEQGETRFIQGAMTTIDNVIKGINYNKGNQNA